MTRVRRALRWVEVSFMGKTPVRGWESETEGRARRPTHRGHSPPGNERDGDDGVRVNVVDDVLPTGAGLIQGETGEVV